jgi:hypothetical protein
MIPVAKIPVAGAVRVGDYCVHGFRLSIPFLLLWLLMLPLLVLVVPVLFIAAIFMQLNAFMVVGALLRVLASLRGTQVEVVNDSVAMLLNIF